LRHKDRAKGATLDSRYLRNRRDATVEQTPLKQRPRKSSAHNAERNFFILLFPIFCGRLFFD
jgi:hypothetical protein